MSEGVFTNMTPQVEHKTKKDIDESTDTYDTVDWLIKTSLLTTVKWVNTELLILVFILLLER